MGTQITKLFNLVTIQNDFIIYRFKDLDENDLFQINWEASEQTPTFKFLKDNLVLNYEFKGHYHAGLTVYNNPIEEKRIGCPNGAIEQYEPLIVNKDTEYYFYPRQDYYDHEPSAAALNHDGRYIGLDDLTIKEIGNTEYLFKMNMEIKYTGIEDDAVLSFMCSYDHLIVEGK